VINSDEFHIQDLNGKNVSKNEAQLIYKKFPHDFENINNYNINVVEQLTKKQKLNIISFILDNDIHNQKQNFSDIILSLDLKYILKILSHPNIQKHLTLSLFENIFENINEEQYKKVLELL